MALLYAGSTALTFGVGTLLARLLGASGYGVYALAMTTATLVGTVTEFGLPVLAMREAGTARADGRWDRLKGLLHWGDRAILVLSALLVAGTWAGYELFARDRSSAYLATLLWAVALIPFVALAKLRAFVLIALDRVFASQFPVMILRPALFVAGCLGWWWLAGSLTPSAAMAVQAGGAAVVLCVVWVLFRRHRPPALVAAQPAYARREWLGAALPMGLTEGLRLLQGQLALILVGVFATTAEAGIYRVADAVAQIAALAASVAGTAATPMFARLWREGDLDGIERIAILAAWAIVGGALVFGLPVAMTGHWLFPTVFGEDFAGSAPVFLVLGGSVIVSGAFGLVVALANMTGHHLLTTRSFALIAVVNLAVAYLAIPSFGAVGAALGTLAGSLAGNAYCAAILFRRTGLNATLLNVRAVPILIEGLKATLRRAPDPD
ncbi:MAG: oligosaccharide flippase family protein [Novosphingobium sp.]